MSSLLVLGWLVLAHLIADFVLQTDTLAAEKYAARPRAVRALGQHAFIVALCLAPFVVAFGAPGLAVLLVVALTHAVVDAAKGRLTRRVEAAAMGLAHEVHEPAARPATLGTGWTPLPAVLFLADQAIHGLVLAAAWWIWLRDAPLTAPWTDFAARLTSGAAPADVHGLAVAVVVGGALLIVNARAGSFFVALLLRPEPALRGATAVSAAATASAPARSGYRLRLGPLVGSIEPEPALPPPPPLRVATPGRVGAAIGIAERLVIVMLMLGGAQLAIGLVIAAKTLARFKQLDDREFAEYYLLGTLASVGIAIGSSIVAIAVAARL